MMLFENEDFFSIFITSATVLICFILTILSCVCGCRKKIPKNELLGLAGLVKITNPDENVNFNTPPNILLNSIEEFNDELNYDTNDLNKRNNNAVATATRSLPDLPVASGDASEKLWSNTENNADTNSDLYATVEDANRKKRALTSGLTVDSSYTPSQTDDSLSPYARLKGEHSYDQLQQNEHPYAQVGKNGGPLPSTSQDSTVNSTPSSHRGGERERERDREGSGRSKSPSLTEAAEEIPAASAIAGAVPANHDLPYMTPPILHQHFSGDSQDSAKGYTSISVREPLARILGRRGDPHYATVSDDSDEMYAAIEERNTSGSETYAQISPPSALPLVIQHQQSVDGRSTSSDDSPRRERRPANSPLPEPPTGLVDDMYAKVMKKKSPEHSPTDAGDSKMLPQTPPCPPGPGPGPCPCPGPDQAPLAGYETLADPNYEELQDHDYASLSRRYESVDPNYESVESGETTEPPYERVEAPDYEVVLRQGGEEVAIDIPQSVLELYAQVNKSPDKSDKPPH